MNKNSPPDLLDLLIMCRVCTPHQKPLTEEPSASRRSHQPVLTLAAPPRGPYTDVPPPQPGACKKHSWAASPAIKWNLCHGKVELK